MRRLLLALALLLTIGAGCASAATWRTSKEGTVGNANVVVTEPTGITSGDFEFVLIASEPVANTITTPAGWTRLFLGTGTAANFYVFSVTGGRGGSAPTLTFTAVGGGGATAEWHCLAVSVSVTIDASAQSTVTTASNPDPPAATAVQITDESIAIGFNVTGAAASGWTAPTGYTLRSLNGTGFSCAAASKTLGASGSENPAAYTNGGTPTSDTYGVTILLANGGTGGGGCTAPPNQLMMLGVGNCKGH